jgi:hypothetical protein
VLTPKLVRSGQVSFTDEMVVISGLKTHGTEERAVPRWVEGNECACAALREIVYTGSPAMLR